MNAESSVKITIQAKTKEQVMAREKSSKTKKQRIRERIPENLKLRINYSKRVCVVESKK